MFERPHLQSFLTFLFKHFNVSVFTAAESDYALFIIKHFILTRPERKLHYFFHRYHVSLGEQRYGEDRIKDLRIYWEYFNLEGFYPCNTFIVDDLPDVQKVNPYNTLRVYPFDLLEKGKPNIQAIYDEVLPQVKLYLKTFLEEWTGCYNMRQLYQPPLVTLKKFT